MIKEPEKRPTLNKRAVEPLIIIIIIIIIIRRRSYLYIDHDDGDYL
jgi:hypothetical protein